MLNTRWIWPTVIMLSAAVIGVMNIFSFDSPIRPMLAIWFLGLCPGMALVRLIHLEDRWTEIMLAIAVSMSLDVGLSLALVYAGLWSANLGLAILIGVSLVGAAAQLRSQETESAALSESQ